MNAIYELASFEHEAVRSVKRDCCRKKCNTRGKIPLFKNILRHLVPLRFKLAYVLTGIRLTEHNTVVLSAKKI